jgi:predicted nucleic acid-binding protein
LAIIERVGRIGRAEREREYLRFISQLVYRYTVIPVTTENLETAARLTQQYPLKAYDAVQLATALQVRQALADQSLTFVCGDRSLLAAAQTEQLSVDNPFDHVTPQKVPGSFD